MHSECRTRYIFVTGGVISGLGKGIVTSSIGKMLQFRGFRVSACKIDPYINFDAGTLRPTEHGEVWVTEDGGEIDQDLGHYERFLDINIPKSHNITTGQVYYEVIRKERRGKYLGQTVQPIPHVTDEIKRRIRRIARDSGADFLLVEIGGTVGDYENILFLEAARQMKLEKEDVLYVHVAYLPIPRSLGEMKTKAVQHSVRELRNFGIQPDFIIGRSETYLDETRKKKIALFCNVNEEDVISDPDVENIYELPLIFERERFGDKILAKLGISGVVSRDEEWRKFVEKVEGLSDEVEVGIVGKYFDIGRFQLPDSYVSVIEAIKHAAWFNDRRPSLRWIDSKILEGGGDFSSLDKVDGIVVPGGFGTTGIEGKIEAIRYARERGIPFLGLCLGFQLAVVEFARNVCGLRDANSSEIDPHTPYPVIDLLPEQREILRKSRYGATMRLGAQIVKIKPGTLAYSLYGASEVRERFRHRYEINPDYVGTLEKAGFMFSGTTPDGRIMQIGELPNHPFFIGSQFHPEFTSRPLRPNPLFNGFIRACIKRRSVKSG
ncbi:MAG: CTP synthase [Nitrososphaerota archaeon]|nr:CTP synthase [Candidatus Bathyarchaeota archaeon]MDW8048176.1 CTP synthase [Nitrososphaerota archaeon]